MGTLAFFSVIKQVQFTSDINYTRKLKALVLYLHFIMIVENWLDEILGVVSLSFFWYTGRKKQIICTTKAAKLKC